MAHIAMKNLPWKRYSAGPEKGDVINAHEKELDALLNTKLTDTCGVERVVLEELTENHPEFVLASSTKPDGRPQATSCREILEYKRSGVWKAIQVCVLISAGTQHFLGLLVLFALRSNAPCVGLGCIKFNL